jgi:hypothetical protein
MEIYIIGVIIAFILGCILAYVEHKKNPEEEQQLGMLAVIGLMSWVSVVVLLWKYRDRYLWLIKKIKKEN